MEETRKILQKIEQPLNFASQNDFKNLIHIKDLGKALLNLSAMLRASLPSGLGDNFSAPVDEFSALFADFDWQKLELKKVKIEKALKLIRQLDNEINLSASFLANQQDDRSRQNISDLKDALAKLKLPVQYLKAVGPKMAERFRVKKIHNVEDLLYFLPRAYEDRREVKKINRLETGKVQTVMGIVVQVEYKYYGRKKILEITVSDNTANLTAKWFKGRTSYLPGVLKKGAKVIFTGLVTPDYVGKAMIHPDYEIMDGNEEENLLNFKRIVPVYSETEGLHQKYMRKIMHQALINYARYISSPLPSDICRKRNLIDLQNAIRLVHFPLNNDHPEDYNLQRSDAHRRLIYDEFFFFELGMAIKKTGHVLAKGIRFTIKSNLLEKFFSRSAFFTDECTKAGNR